jgi:hypothetical protein
MVCAALRDRRSNSPEHHEMAIIAAADHADAIGSQTVLPAVLPCCRTPLCVLVPPAPQVITCCALRQRAATGIAATAHTHPLNRLLLIVDQGHCLRQVIVLSYAGEDAQNVACKGVEFVRHSSVQSKASMKPYL